MHLMLHECLILHTSPTHTRKTHGGDLTEIQKHTEAEIEGQIQVLSLHLSRWSIAWNTITQHGYVRCADPPKPFYETGCLEDVYVQAE